MSLSYFTINNWRDMEYPIYSPLDLAHSKVIKYVLFDRRRLPGSRSLWWRYALRQKSQNDL